MYYEAGYRPLRSNNLAGGHQTIPAGLYGNPAMQKKILVDLDFSGEIQDICCGDRPSGLRIGRVSGSRAIHIILPGALAYSAGAYLIAASHNAHRVRTTSDGRITIRPGDSDDDPTSASILEQIEAALADGRGGLIGTYGTYTVRQSLDEWRYEVETKPSGRASLKAIGDWSGEPGLFFVPYANHAALDRVMGRAIKAEARGETTTANLPDVPGVNVRVEGGEIVIGDPGREFSSVLRAIPTLRWDGDRRAYAVSTRYTRRVASALAEIAVPLREAQERAERTKAEQAATYAARFAIAEADRANGPLGTSRVSIQENTSRIYVQFRYDAAAVSEIKSVPGARWDKTIRSWYVDFAERPALRSAITRIDSILAASEPAQSPIAVAEPPRPLNQWDTILVTEAPVGAIIRQEGAVLEVVRLGRSVKIDDEMPSIYGSHLLGHEGEWAVRATVRKLSEDEVEAISDRQIITTNWGRPCRGEMIAEFGDQG